jgi:hypothetical protein
MRSRIKVCFDPVDSEYRSRPSTALICDLPDQASRTARSDWFAVTATRTQSYTKRKSRNNFASWHVRELVCPDFVSNSKYLMIETLNIHKINSLNLNVKIRTT